MTTKSNSTDKVHASMLTGLLVISFMLALIANGVAAIAQGSSLTAFCAGMLATWFTLAAVLIWWCWK